MKLFEICSVVLFLVALYMVEAGPFGSHAVALHNGGYGTFDMKSYNPDIVRKVLSSMSAEGIKAEYRYYVCDFLFIAAMFLFQYMISRRFLNKQFFYASIIVAAIRGIADAVENILLIITIHSFPAVNESIINISSYATKLKLFSIAVWNVIFIVGVIYGIYIKRK